MIVAAKDRSRVGLVTAYRANHEDGHALVAGIRFDPYSRSPSMIIGIGMFIDYLFACWSFRKLYMEVPEYNYRQFASGLGRVFTLEARLRDHYYLDGERWDQLTLAIYRDTWNRHPKRFREVEGGG